MCVSGCCGCCWEEKKLAADPRRRGPVGGGVGLGGTACRLCYVLDMNFFSGLRGIFFFVHLFL